MTEKISIVGVDKEGVGSPRNDGTAGSGLYEVPLRLDQTPSVDWARIFQQTWDSPPRWSSMHRPGIARVAGDRVILDGTTVEEVRDYHLATAKLCVQVTNEEIAKLEARRKQQQQVSEEAEGEHRKRVDEVIDEMDFEDDGSE